MQAVRVGLRYGQRGWRQVKPVNTVAKRTHVYDKRSQTILDDYNALPRASPWDHITHRNMQKRFKRYNQYSMWMALFLFTYMWFRVEVVRVRKNKVEKWDYQSVYWRDGHWIREFPEGLVVKEYSNGRYSVEPGITPRPSFGSRCVRKFFAIGYD